jgi:hypothetical protein
MEHVSAAYESIVGSPLQYERKTYLDGLQEAKRSVTKQENALTNTHTVPFNKYKVFFGFMKSYVTTYIFGHCPHEFPAWYALQMLVLVPVQAYRWGPNLNGWSSSRSSAGSPTSRWRFTA